MQKILFVVLLKSVFTNGVSANEDSPEPVLFLPLNKQYGTRDISKSNLPTTAVGVSLSTGPDGKPGGSYYFPGRSSSYIDVPKDSAIDTRYSMTVSAWLIHTDGVNGPVLHYDTLQSSHSWGFHIYITAGKNIFCRPSPRDHSALPIGVSYDLSPTNRWRYFAYTYNYNTGIQKLFIDGVEVRKVNISSLEFATQYKIKLGGQKMGDDRFFKGRISCLQIYNKALSEDQILKAKTFCDRNEFPEPVLFLPLNEQYGTRDISKSNLPTTAVGVTLSPGPDGEPNGSYYFQGSSSSYIEVPQDSKTDTRYSMTIILWIYVQGGNGPIVHYDTLSTQWAFRLYSLTGGNVFVRHINRNGSPSPPSMRTKSLKLNSWWYVAHAYDYNTGIQKLYVNGVEIENQDVGKIELKTQHKIKIGGHKYGQSSFFNGRISCLQIYSKALSEDQILTVQQFCDKSDLPEPVLFLPLNKQYGTRDISKSNLPTTAVGLTLSPGPDGKPNGSYYFPGSDNSYIDVPKDSKTDTRYTMSFFTWIYNEGRYGPVLNYETGGSAWGFHIYIQVYDPESKFYVSFVTRDNLNDNGIIRLEKPMATNAWQYVGFTYDFVAGIARMYIDGIIVQSSAAPKFELNTKFKIRVGGVKYGHVSTYAFKGRLSCVQIYDKALTHAQVLASQRHCARNTQESEICSACVDYKSIDDPTRLPNAKSAKPSDRVSLSRRTHWYRLTGKRISSTCPKSGSCGTQTPGWLNGTYPTLEDGIKKMELCYRTAGSNCCASKVNVLVRQCYGYYVFKFEDFPDDGRFCTEEDTNTFDDIMFLSTYERCLTGHVFHNETDVTDVSRCIGYCLSAGENCKSVNFINEESGKCQLNNAVKGEGVLHVDSKCDYYEKV